MAELEDGVGGATATQELEDCVDSSAATQPAQPTKYYDEPIEDHNESKGFYEPMSDLETPDSKEGIDGPPEEEEEKDDSLAEISKSSFQRTNSEYNAYGSVTRLRSRMKFEDHYTLPAPSSTTRFENSDVKVYGMSSGMQIHIEDRGDNTFLTRQVSDNSFGQQMLRFWYSVIVFVMLGLLLCFTMQLLFNVFVSLTLSAGLTSAGESSPWLFIVVLLSYPCWVFGLSSGMSIASAFLMDTWRGNKFVKSFAPAKSVWVDWITFMIFLGIPMLTLIITLFADALWWKITSMVWVSLAFAYYCFYAGAMLFYEIRACFELIRHDPNYQKRGKTTWPWMVLAAIEFNNNYRLCGVKRYNYLRKSQISACNSGKAISEDGDDVDKGKPRIGLWSRFTMLNIWERHGLVTKLEKRRFNMTEIEGGQPVVTSHTWELEKFYLRSHTDHYYIIISGPGALTEQQLRSSLVCSLLTMALLFLLIAAFVEYIGHYLILVLIFLAAFVLITVIPRSLMLYKRYKFLKDANIVETIAEDKGTGNSTAFLEVEEKWEINKINPKFSWFVFVLEIIAFVIIPFFAFTVTMKSLAIGLFFLLISLVSLVRYYLNPSHLLQSFGKLDEYMDDPNDKGEHGDWRDHHRTGFILKHITKGKTRNMWRSFFAGFIFLFLVLFVAAYLQGVSEGMENDSLDNSKRNYYWPRQEGVSYPTCKLEDAKFEDTGLVDYTYLAYAASFAPDSVQEVLDIWFGKDATTNTSIAVSQQEVINEFKSQLDPISANSPVTYRLVKFPSNSTVIGDFYIVTVRGTSNLWDMMADMQLWSSAVFVQTLRSIVPFGDILDYVYTEYIGAMGLLKTDDIIKVEFYKTITAFVEWLREEKQYKNIHLTGHSLGGGIAMISGVQTKTPAYALSGPNAILGRKTYNPPLELEEINRWTFNIVPDRDAVPRIDLLAQNSQDIRCLAPRNQPYACHRATRSLCELMYKCGSQGRPIFCNCVLEYGYPEPTPWQKSGQIPFKKFCEIGNAAPMNNSR